MKLFLATLIIFFCSLGFAQEDLEDAEFDDSSFLQSVNNSPAYTDVNDDIESIPYQKAPKLNPNTKIITTQKGKFIYHPNQEKGLYKITRSNEYLYKYKKSELKGFIHIKGGSLNLENFPTEPTDGGQSLFEELYDSDSLTTIYLEYEWQPLKKFRSISFKAGFGLSYARGKGRFLDTSLAGAQAQEAYTFMMFPLSVGVIYKFKFMNNQLFIPFGTAAIDYNLATEFRSGFKAFKYAGVLASHFGGGVLLNLGWLEKTAALDLDREFGINNTYLSLEARTVVSLYDDKNIDGLVFLAGLSFEY